MTSFMMNGTGGELLTASEYLSQLLKDRKLLQTSSSSFIHVERILEAEISRVRGNVLYLGINTEPISLPEPAGPIIVIQEKIWVPTKEHPDFNFVGRILGPRGMTAKQLELDTGCKILVRGHGSMRDKYKEEQMKGKAKWEHLNEELHVVVSVEDTMNRASVKLKRAVEEIKKLLQPIPDNEDELKKRQLTELALLNGTYRGLNGFVIANPGQMANGFSMHDGSVPLMLRSPMDHSMGSIVMAPASPIQMVPSHSLGSPAPSLTPLMTPIQSGGMPPLMFPAITTPDGGIFYHMETCLPQQQHHIFPISGPTSPIFDYPPPTLSIHLQQVA